MSLEQVFEERGLSNPKEPVGDHDLNDRVVPLSYAFLLRRQYGACRCDLTNRSKDPAP